MDARFDELDSSLQSLREREGKVSANLVAEFRKRFEISVIYHDSALEGVVLSYSEIKAAIDKNIISDVSLIPSYQEIKNFKDAVDYAREAAEDRKKPIGIETIRKIYGILTPEEVAKGLPYRKDNPLHRHYYHEISTPDKIPARMKILQTWLEEDSTRRMHPVDRAARASHMRLHRDWIFSTFEPENRALGTTRNQSVGRGFLEGNLATRQELPMLGGPFCRPGVYAHTSTPGSFSQITVMAYAPLTSRSAA